MYGTQLKLRRQRLGLTHALVARICNEFQGISMGVTERDVRNNERISDEAINNSDLTWVIWRAIEFVEADIDKRIVSMKRAVTCGTKPSKLLVSSAVLLCCRNQADLDLLYPNEAPYGMAHHRAFIGMAFLALSGNIRKHLWVLTLPRRFVRLAQSEPEECSREFMFDWFAGEYDAYPINSPRYRPKPVSLQSAAKPASGN